MADKVNNTNTTQFGGGLNLDASNKLQPKGTYRFALNAVLESREGDKGLITNEESNEIFSCLTDGYLPVGRKYIGNGETVILSVSKDNKDSEIGIISSDGTYEVYVNDSQSDENNKLNFDINRQIEIVYRLRKGCEKTIYFVGKGYPPRYFNFNKAGSFKEDGKWVGNKFDLFRKISVAPRVNNIEVQDNMGSLKPGSVTVLVQYLDDDFNPTGFVELVSNINIVNDSLTDTYSSIQGSTNLGEGKDNMQLYAYERTSKAISISLKDVDKSFPYVRFAFVEYNSGTGAITDVRYSDKISSVNPNFIYTGLNAETKGSIEEVQLTNLTNITSAEHIEQIDNMLILASTTGEDSDMCKLQQYASRITADCYIKDIILTTIDEKHNPKNPLVIHNGLSHQPGDVYSYGIVYKFDDNTYSPVLHIPGKSDKVSNSHIYSPGKNVYPMSNIKNKNLSETYVENSSCNNEGYESYWGKDFEGNILANQNVRHHRFPTRDQLGVDFVKKTPISIENSEYKRVSLFIKGDVKKSVVCEQDDDSCVPYTAPVYTLTVSYTVGGELEEMSVVINPDSGNIPTLLTSNIYLANQLIENLKLVRSVSDSNGDIISTEIAITDGQSDIQDNGLSYELLVGTLNENDNKNIYQVPIFGIKFSNIQIPTPDIIGKKVVGYQIVRQERKNEDKTILDSAVILPMIERGQFISSSFIAPDFKNFESKGNNDLGNKVSKDTVQILTPLHKFTDKTFDEYTSIEEVGRYNIAKKTYSGFSIQNVMDGSSADGVDKISNNTKDDDGYTLKQAIRFTEVDYAKSTGTKFNIDNKSKRLYNLEGLSSASHIKEGRTIYNLSCDNKSLILAKSDNSDIRTYVPNDHHFPYVYIKRDNQIFYQGFRNKPYFSVDNQLYTDSTCVVFGGDTYIAPLRYSTDFFCNAIAGRRLTKYSIGKIILAGIIAVVGVVLSVFTAGAAGVASATAIAALLAASGGIVLAAGAILNIVATIVDVKKFSDIYEEKWEKGLKDTVLDEYYQKIFVDPNVTNKINKQLWYRDDTFKWFGEIAGDFWFETSLNISLRVPPKESSSQNYLRPLTPIMTDRQDIVQALTRLGKNSEKRDGADTYHFYEDINVDSGFGTEENYFLGKVTVPDNNRSSGRNYIGIAIPIVYMVNNDHSVISKIKSYYQLPLQYDCCSECREHFPHRYYHSQQSFQEELTDNYRTFLPNNYRDLEGETGRITNMFKLGSDLFFHTEEALWQQPRNFQERVTDQIVSFIGTGSYFEVPPRKIVDDDTGNSAGCTHKWSGLKTSDGYFFVCERESRIYNFNGKNLINLSDKGLSAWFKANIKIKTSGNKDNPYNPKGTGFISAYDTLNNRILFTKLDRNYKHNYGWTISYSLKTNSWISWHSYIPNMYFTTTDNIFSWTSESDYIFKHNKKGNYQTYYSKLYPFIIDYPSVAEDLSTRVYDSLDIILDTQEYDSLGDQYYPVNKFFNKAVFYNSTQCSGLLNIVTKDNESQDYFFNQVNNINIDEIIVDKNEKNWNINELRDIRTDYSQPIWTAANSSTVNGYTDKTLNSSTMSFEKDWSQLESFRDKYLNIRLIFDKFADTKLVLNISNENETISQR